MFKKELHDTLKSFADLLLIAVGIITFSFFLVRVILGLEIAFRDILQPLSWTALFIIAFYLGSAVFSQESGGKTFEYFFSLPVDRRKVLFYKVFPRFLAFFFFTLLNFLFDGVIFKNHPPLDRGILFLLLLAIFLIAVSQSLMYKRSSTVILSNIFGLSFLFGIAWALLRFFGENSAKVLLSYFTAVFALISLALFSGFVLRFRAMDMDNMQRLSRKNMFQVLLPVGVFLLLFFAVNQVDAGKPTDVFTPGNLLPASLDKANGFYRLWTLAEPAGTEVQDEATIKIYRELAAPRLDHTKSQEQFDSKAYRQRTEKNTDNIRMIIELITGIRADLWKYLASPELNLEKLEQEYSYLLERYQELVDTPLVEDFSSVHWWGYPTFNHLAWLRVAKLYVAVNAADAVSGRWEQGISHLLAHIVFARKIVNNSRNFITNLIGKSVASLSLQMLVALMNRQDCPKQVYRQILAGLPPLKKEDFKTKNSLVFEALAFEKRLKGVINNEDREPGDFLQRIPLILFTQENRTIDYVHRYIKKVIQFEDTPPFQWKTGLPQVKTDRGFFWWFVNPGGKMLIRQSLISYPALFLKTYRVRTFYDITRIAAALHLNDDPAQPVEKVLNRLEIYTQSIDPCSGKPYRWNRQKQVLYSIGTDRKDDNGKYDMTTLNTDFALPVRLKGR